MSNSPAKFDRSIFLRRMHTARIRQFAIAGISLTAAVILLFVTNAHEIGWFAFHAIIVLLLANAIMALRQYQRIIRPIAAILMNLKELSDRLEQDAPLDSIHRTPQREEAFIDLSNGIALVVNQLIERTLRAEIGMKFQQDVVRATQFTIFTVSRTGKTLSILQDGYKVVPLLNLKVGAGLDPNFCGKDNVANYQKAIADMFDGKGNGWFDVVLSRAPKHSAHHLRMLAAKMNEVTAVVFLGDLGEIDLKVGQNTDPQPQNHDFSDHQMSLRRFAASIAHDTKNIFATLSNLLEIDRNSSDEVVRAQIPIIEDAISRGTELMRVMMTYSGQARYAFTCMRANDVLRKLTDSPSMKAIVPTNVQIIADIHDNLPYIDVDLDKLWRVPFNLLKNAIEAMGESGGRIWIKAEPYEMTAERATLFRHTSQMRMGPGVLFTRIDDGPGITRGILLHIFDPYYSSKGEGRGLGIPTALSIIVAHGGAMRVDSEIGHGATFQSWLPVSRNSPEELSLINEIAPNGAVLLVDDDPSILRTTRLVLKTLKIAAHPASTDEEAMSKLSSLNRRLSAVILDAHLGGATSAGLLRAIRFQMPELPIILVSGSNEDSIRDAFADAKYDHYLEKPYSIVDLAKALNISMASPA